MKTSTLLFIFVVLFNITTYPFEFNNKIENKTYSNSIATVEMYRKGYTLSNPIISLGSNEELVFSFDDLSGEAADYQYTIYHCTRNWQISAIDQSEYLDAFLDYPLDDYAYSINTNIKYVNYMLTLPNENVQFKLSGNYALVVFDRDNPNQALITRRFYVLEEETKIDARIHKSINDGPRGEHQQIRFTVDLGNFDVVNYNTDIQVVLTQNNRTDNTISNLEPVFINNGILEYDHTSGNIFKGENEFRAFDTRNYKYPGINVESIDFFEPLYHATLIRHIPRVQKRYSFYEDMNGNFNIGAFNKPEPEIEADYMMVHFTLDIKQPLMGGDIYIFGKLSDWQCSAFNKMKYNFETQRYEHSMLLKQGFYNFLYAYRDNYSGQIKAYNLEGSYSETENDYYIFVYYGRLSDRYDRLIGYNRFNSSRNRGF